MKMKRNLFVRKVECWQCAKKIHLAVLTRYNGVLCKNCYEEKYEALKTLFHELTLFFPFQLF